MILIIILNIRKLKISLQAKSEKKFLNLVFATKLEIFLFIWEIKTDANISSCKYRLLTILISTWDYYQI